MLATICQADIAILVGIMPKNRHNFLGEYLYLQTFVLIRNFQTFRG